MWQLYNPVTRQQVQSSRPGQASTSIGSASGWEKSEAAREGSAPSNTLYTSGQRTHGITIMVQVHRTSPRGGAAGAQPISELMVESTRLDEYRAYYCIPGGESVHALCGMGIYH